MSLSVRLTAALTLAAVLLFGAVGTWQLRAEEHDLRHSVRRDLKRLGRVLEVSFENALRDRQAEDVQETLRELERIDPHVDVYVYDANGAQLAVSTGALPRAEAPAPSLGPVLRFVPPDAARVELFAPLELTRERRAAMLVVSRPLDDMYADLDATRRRVVLSVLSFVLIVALMTMALSRYWVGRPLAAMIERMRRVREGDLSTSRAVPRTGEVGATLDAFDALVNDLRETRARLVGEAEARRRMEGQLRELDKMRAVGQLAAGLAHEIGSPLQILEGRLAGLEGKADDPAETRRVARILLEQAQRITRIVSRLTTVARRPAEHTRHFAPLPPVRAVVELLEGEARRRGITLALHHDEALPEIDGDPDALQQIVLNLVRNALDATAEKGHVDVRLETSGPSVLRVSVRDDGRGMDEATRAHAFEPFFTTRASTGGTGLGLAVVKGIVDEMRGSIDLRSAPDAGTTLTIDVPVVAGAAS